MLKLERINENEYQKIVDWNNGKNEDYLYQWAGHKVYKYPISAEQIKARTAEENSQIFVIFNDGEAIGSIELDKINYEKASANICRFILSDEFKHKGFGTLALKQLINVAFDEMNLNKFTLGVFCYNVGAIRCYEKCGFLVKEFHQREDAKWNSYTMELFKTVSDVK